MEKLRMVSAPLGPEGFIHYERGDRSFHLRHDGKVLINVKPESGRIEGWSAVKQELNGMVRAYIIHPFLLPFYAFHQEGEGLLRYNIQCRGVATDGRFEVIRAEPDSLTYMMRGNRACLIRTFTLAKTTLEVECDRNLLVGFDSGEFRIPEASVPERKFRRPIVLERYAAMHVLRPLLQKGFLSPSLLSAEWQGAARWGSPALLPFANKPQTYGGVVLYSSETMRVCLRGDDVWCWGKPLLAELSRRGCATPPTSEWLKASRVDLATALHSLKILPEGAI